MIYECFEDGFPLLVFVGVDWGYGHFLLRMGL